MKKIYLVLAVIVIAVSVFSAYSLANANSLAGEYGAIENSNLSLTVKKADGGWDFEVKDIYDKTAIKGTFRKETDKDGEWLVPFSTGFDSLNLKGDRFRIWKDNRLIVDGLIWMKL